MPNVRVYLKYFNTTLDLLLDDVNKLRGKGANRAAEAELGALHQKLTAIKTLMTDECPVVQFRNFEISEAGAAPRAKARPTRARARTRKAR